MRRQFTPCVAFGALLAAWVGVCACTKSGGASVSTDSDADGLSDRDERLIYGTSPILADTDGDGVSDYDEIVTFAFDPGTDSFRWNPRVADVPEMRLVFTGPPVVKLNLTDRQGETRTIQTSQAVQHGSSTRGATTTTNGTAETISRVDQSTQQRGSSQTITDALGISRGSSATTTLGGEEGSAGAAVGGAGGAGGSGGAGGAGGGAADGGADSGGGGQDGGAGPGGGAQGGGGEAGGGGREGGSGRPVTVGTTTGTTANSSEANTASESASASSSFGDSVTSSANLAFTEEQTASYSETYLDLEAYAASHDITAVGGLMTITARIENPSHLAFRVTSIILSATIKDGSGVTKPVGNLVVDAPYTEYTPFSMPPFGKTGPINFIRRELTLELARSILPDARSVQFEVPILELSDFDGRPYVFDSPAVLAKTALVSIDYGQHRAPERHHVATNGDPSRPGITATTAFGDILGIPYRVDGARGISAVRSLGAPATGGGRWVLTHTHRVASEPTTTSYDPNSEPYDPGSIELRGGDELLVAFVES